MEEISFKRQKEESQEDSNSSELDGSSSKRQKPYNNILNLLDEEEDPSDELSQDLSAIFTTFEQELSSSTSCDSTTTFDFDSLPPRAEVELAEQSQLPISGGGVDEDESVKSVMRHLLEASDDELGIPNAGDENGVENFNAAVNLPLEFSDEHGLWELEDVTANYYTVLQSELFMQ